MDFKKIINTVYPNSIFDVNIKNVMGNCLKKIFKAEEYDERDVDALFSRFGHKEEINIKNLSFYQNFVFSVDLKSEKTKKPVYVLRKDSDLILVDGYHRVYDAIINKRPSVIALVIDADIHITDESFYDLSENKKLSLTEKILNEYAMDLKSIFSDVNQQLYGFIQRDMTSFPTVEEKLKAINKIEKYRMKSGDGLPEFLIDPHRLVATQDSVDSERIERANLNKPVFVVKLNGSYFCLDGHHRAAKALKQGEKKIKMRLLNFDAENFPFN